MNGKALLKLKYLFLFLYLISFSAAFGQKEVKMAGDTTNENFMRSVRKLEAQGWNVKIVPPSEMEEPGKSKARYGEIYKDNPLPEFSVTDLDGNVITANDLRGKIVHINFWSVTCAPCIEEFPELNELKALYGEDDVIFLAIAPESESKVKKVLSKHPLDYIVVAEASQLFKTLGINGYPVNFFVDREGIIREVMNGSTYKGVMIDGKMEMKPDNFRLYDKVMKSISKK